MRAVNLVPAEERRARGAAGRSGGVVHIALAALALLVVMVGAVTVTSKSISDRKSELARVTAEANAAEAKANELLPYTRFAAMREARVQTVSSLVASRFDWSRVLHEIARVVPADAWLTGLTGTRPAPAAAAASTGSAPAAPSFQVTGCTSGHKSVARMMVRMRLIDGVEKVALSSSDEIDGSGATASAGSAGKSGDGCVTRSRRGAQFALTVNFKAAPAAAPSTGTSAPAPAATSAAPTGATP